MVPERVVLGSLSVLLADKNLHLFLWRFFLAFHSSVYFRYLTDTTSTAEELE